jgi:hypothetical protein
MRKNVTISLWYNLGQTDVNAFPDAPELGECPHAQLAMRHMGITYAIAEPHSISDCWVFYDCQNIPPAPYPKWMAVSEGGMTRQEFYDMSMLRVKTTPEPDGQKFPVGSRVKVADDLGPHMRHFPGAGKLATVHHTYAHAYGGSNVKSYCLEIDSVGSSAWYEEGQLSAL